MEGGINFKGLVYDAVARTIRIAPHEVNSGVNFMVNEKDGLFEAALHIPILSESGYAFGPFTSGRVATRRMAEHQAASMALEVNWPDVAQGAKAVYESQRAGGEQAPPGTNRKGKLLNDLQILIARNIKPGDVTFDTVPMADANGQMYVSTVSFIGIGREDHYTGEPRSTEKEAEHSAADVASAALAPEFTMAYRILEEKKEKKAIRKAMGLQGCSDRETGRMHLSEARSRPYQ